ncbi:MAG: hypothetical protein J7647_32640 [Cyanobacteria bacterium SBLK]|nr:hypothetical protein [Cyanobacteria bacterium SBLK]
MTQHLGIIFVYQDTSQPADRVRSPFSLNERASGNAWRLTARTNQAAIMAKPALAIAIIEKISQQYPGIAAELKQMVHRY